MQVSADSAMPPHMIADLDRATFSNIEQQSLEFVMHTMTPWAERWEASIESDLLLEGDEIEVEFDFSNLMRGDAASRSAYYQSGIQNGWLTRNEARIAENLNPIDGLDEPLRPLNMVEEDDAEDQEFDEEAAEDPAQETAEPSGDEQAQRMRAVIASTADRLARRISRAGRLEDKDLELISKALAVPVSRVQRWAECRPNKLEDKQMDASILRESLIQLGMNP